MLTNVKSILMNILQIVDKENSSEYNNCKCYMSSIQYFCLYIKLNNLQMYLHRQLMSQCKDHFNLCIQALKLNYHQILRCGIYEEDFHCSFSYKYNYLGTHIQWHLLHFISLNKYCNKL
jgi:hypothetical protein